jgi:AhpD family alkylhydroperoxidase
MTSAHSDTVTTDAVVPTPRGDDTGGMAPAYRAMVAFDQAITLDPALRELVKLRASVLNGCAFCVDMHTTEAREAGEGDRRLAAVAAWRHAPFFTARERAALALTDAATRLGDEGVPDEIWDEARAHFSPDELGNLVWAIAAINSWNRLAVTLQTTPPT